MSGGVGGPPSLAKEKSKEGNNSNNNMNSSSNNNSKRSESFADFSMVKLRHWLPVAGQQASWSDVVMGEKKFKGMLQHLQRAKPTPDDFLAIVTETKRWLSIAQAAQLREAVAFSDSNALAMVECALLWRVVERWNLGHDVSTALFQHCDAAILASFRHPWYVLSSIYSLFQSVLSSCSNGFRHSGGCLEVFFFFFFFFFFLPFCPLSLIDSFFSSKA
jgi:hypothetical protein